MNDQPKYWARRGRHKVGPYPSRKEALDAFREAHPFKGKEYKKNSTKAMISSGYGEFGPYFHIEWSSA